MEVVVENPTGSTLVLVALGIFISGGLIVWALIMAFRQSKSSDEGYEFDMTRARRIQEESELDLALTNKLVPAVFYGTLPALKDAILSGQPEKAIPAFRDSIKFLCVEDEIHTKLLDWLAAKYYHVLKDGGISRPALEWKIDSGAFRFKVSWGYTSREFTI